LGVSLPPNPQAQQVIIFFPAGEKNAFCACWAPALCLRAKLLFSCSLPPGRICSSLISLASGPGSLSPFSSLSLSLLSLGFFVLVSHLGLNEERY